jgi:hypothetical protein
MKLWRHPKIEGSVLNCRVPFEPMYTGERRTTFAKANGIEVRCCWELFALIPPPKTKNKFACKVDCPSGK